MIYQLSVTVLATNPQTQWLKTTNINEFIVSIDQEPWHSFTGYPWLRVSHKAAKQGVGQSFSDFKAGLEEDILPQSLTD